MNTGNSMLRYTAAAGAAAAIAGLGVPAQAAPVTPIAQRPWAISMATAHANGSYTVTQSPSGLARTYTIVGVLTNDWGGQCYFVKVNGGSPPGQASGRSCGPTNPVKIDFKVKASTGTVSLQICRGTGVSVGCGQATRLA